MSEPKPRKCGAYTREWRTLDWLPGYEISSDGFVRTLVQRSNVPPGTVLTGCIDDSGYRKFKLTTITGARQLYAHSLVAEAWHGSRRNALHRQVAHGDGDRLNNNHTNLRWVSPAENQADRVGHGTDPVGERNPRALLSWDSVREIRARYSGKHGEITTLAREYGVSHGAMCAVLDGRHWRE